MYKILVVDDEYWIRKGIVQMIDCEKDRIAAIFEAAAVKQAKEIFDREHPDIVLADICFPTESGCDLGEYIYSRDPRVRIVIISAHPDFSYAQQALRFRAYSYLLKPVSTVKLNQTIRDCTEELAALDARSGAAEPRSGNINFSEAVVRKIIEDLDRDCAQKISLPRLAAKHHISEAYLSHMFKRLTGKSLTNYLAQIRIERASQLITMNRDNPEKFYTIAQQVGYEDYQYFVRVFKKVLGVSPREFHAQLLQERGGVNDADP